MVKSAAEILREAAQTYEEKNREYGDNFLRVGAAMAALFPEGVTLKTEQDWNRMHIYLLAVVKMSRYAVNWGQGHQDSIRDATVYCAMLEMIDGLP